MHVYHEKLELMDGKAKESGVTHGTSRWKWSLQLFYVSLRTLNGPCYVLTWSYFFLITSVNVTLSTMIFYLVWDLLDISEVGDRWAPGLDKQCHQLEYIWSFVPIHAPRTKLVAETELCWSKEIRWPLLKLRKTSVSAHEKEGSLGNQKGKGHHPIKVRTWIHRPLQWDLL